MYELVTLVIASGIAGVAGLFIGWLIGSQSSSDDHHEKERLEVQIDELKKQSEDYQTEVTHHFAKTASLLNQLTNTYRDVHNHLAEGAYNLTAGENELRKLVKTTEDEQHEKVVEEVKPPLDYAPKNGDHNEGVLSEKYGLNQNDADS